MTDTTAVSVWVFGQRIRNFSASFAWASCAYLAYRFSPHAANLRHIWSDVFQISGTQLLTSGYVAYSVLLLLFYAFERAPGEAKAIAALRGLKGLAMAPVRTVREGLPKAERLGLLAMLLKGFFAPLMALSLFDFTSLMIKNGSYVFAHWDVLGTDFLYVFNSHGFWFLFQVILFMDVVFFTIGYLIEHPVLKNEIRSVDPTWLGWGVTLICYPPINGITAQVLGGNVEYFPQFADPRVHIGVNGLLLVLMAIYASASVALNLKGSNLTHRGIISHGPYRYIRHPAYICKNIAWWLGTLPALFVAWERSAWDAFIVVGGAAAWTAVYTLRALTEEDHLKSVDGEYAVYCQKVRYRFIPGVY
jgi:protein-S-isoprenylcysteine O-methyltransferase Ste14